MSHNRDPFVNRKDELADFAARLEGRGEGCVLLYCGIQGAGKTALLDRLRTVCRDQERTCTRLELWHDVLAEPEEIIERLRGRIPDLGQSMESEGEAVSQVLPEQVAMGTLLSGQMGAGPSFPPEPAPGGTYTATMGDVTRSIVQTGQGNAVFYNSPIYLSPEQAPAKVKQIGVRGLSADLREGLRQLAAQELLVLLFDGCDEGSNEARKWLWSELLDPLLEGSLPFPSNLMIVLAGDPECEKGMWLKQVIGCREAVCVYELGELDPEWVREYWINRRGLDEARLQEVFPPGPVLAADLVVMANRWEGAR